MGTNRSSRVPLGLALLATAVAAALYIFLRIYFYEDRLIPLTYALPLLLALWHGYRPLHWVSTAFYCGLALLNVLLVDAAAGSVLVNYSMMLVNILTVSAVVDRLLVSRERLLESNLQLREANAELEASNEELAARDEEISSQNEELQQQTEELEQQSTELQQQSEELQQQAEGLQVLHEESATRANLLQALLDAVTATETGPPLDHICAAAAGAFDCDAAAVLLSENGVFDVQGAWKLSAADETLRAALATDPFIALVAQENRTACLEDLASLPANVTRLAGEFRTVLGSPLELEGAPAGVLVIYGRAPREWTETEFSVIRWFAAQAALALRTIQLQEELSRRSQEAEENTRQKTRFLAAVSHDVRNPANAINLMAELIQRSGDDPRLASEIPRLAESLRVNTRLLVELVSDVLDLSRFDSGKIDLEETTFDPAELIRAEVGQYEPLAKNAGLALCVETTAPANLRVKTDRMKLARVLGNLVNNAIKFTEVGSVRTTLRQLVDGSLEIAVQDTGVGIAAEHLEHIFDEFFQIRNPERDRSKGTGLGLAICKRLIDAIGCSLDVDSQLGCGTTFRVRVPAAMIVETDCQPKVVRSAGERGDHVLAGLQVLVVEDHETTRLAVTRLLAAHGATVDPAEDGRAALRHLRHGIHDVLLLDLMLPDMDGREILRQLQGSRPDRLKCILAVSGDVSEARRQELQVLGASDLIPKPVEMDHLVQRITGAVRPLAETAERTTE